MSSKFPRILKSTKQVIYHQKTTSMTKSQFNDISDTKSAYLSVYRRFIRLKPFVSQMAYMKEGYSRYIRSKFKEDYNARKIQVLNLKNSAEMDTPSQLVDRMLNTLDFMNNAMCHVPRGKEGKMEKKILTNILMVFLDKENVKSLSHYKYRWISELTESIESNTDSKKSLNSLVMREYEVNLMRLNETCNLCL